MLDLGPKSNRSFSRLEWIGFTFFVGVWSIATLYADCFLVSRIIGLRGDSLFFLMFLTPFNLIMALLVWAYIDSWKKAPSRSLPEIEETGDHVHIRLGPTPLAAATLTFLIATAIGSVFTPWCTCGAISSVTGWGIAWAVVFSLTAYSAIYVRHRRAERYYDITLDLSRQTLMLPPMITKSDRWVIPFADIRSLGVVEWLDHENEKRYRATIHWIGEENEARDAILMESSDKASADALVACIQADVERHRRRNESKPSEPSDWQGE